MPASKPTPIFIAVNRHRCGICGCCVPVCPPDAITLHDNYLAVNNDMCTDCLKCIPVCPTHALSAIPQEAVAARGGVL
jgi:ferredoxin